MELKNVAYDKFARWGQKVWQISFNRLFLLISNMIKDWLGGMRWADFLTAKV
jgi:hypothetical protein